MWLPHGLAAGTQLSALKPLIKICAFSDPFADNSACTDKAFELSRPSNGTLVASVPELTPKQHYRVTVNADATVCVCVCVFELGCLLYQPGRLAIVSGHITPGPVVYM